MLVTCPKIFWGSLIPFKRAGGIISYVNFWNYFKKYLIKIYTNTHQIAAFFKIFSEDLLNPVMYAHLSLFEKKNYDTKRSTFPNFLKVLFNS